MLKHWTHKGWLSVGDDADCHETVFLNGEPITEELDYMDRHLVTVRYYISDKEDTLENIQDNFIKSLHGDSVAEYYPVYSEMTGYLWTTENLKIGGHNLLQELETYHGKYLYLLVDIEDVEE